MRVIVLGANSLWVELAKLFAGEMHDVVVIDEDPRNLQSLGRDFNGSSIGGPFIDIDVYRTAGVDDAGAFLAVTDSDNINLMGAQMAKRLFDVPKVVARLYDPSLKETYEKLDIEAVAPSQSAAFEIRNSIVDADFKRYPLLYDEIEVLRLLVPEGFERTPLTEIESEGRIRAVALVRGGKAELVNEKTYVEAADILVVAARRTEVAELMERFIRD